MPLTKKGKEIFSAMASEYGPKKGKQIFYASANKGTIKGVHKKRKNIPGMSVHPVIDCNYAKRKHTV